MARPPNHTLKHKDPEATREERKEQRSPQTRTDHDGRPWFASDDEAANGVGKYPGTANPSADDATKPKKTTGEKS